MDKTEFVAAVHIAVYRTSIEAVGKLLIAPPGQRPRPNLVALSQWYNALDESAKEQVQEVVKLSVEQTTFGMLAALDGERTLGQGVEFSLLDSDGHDLTADHDLHDEFRWLIDNEDRS